MGGHNINVLGEGGNRLCKGMILRTLRVMVMAVLMLALTVAMVSTTCTCYAQLRLSHDSWESSLVDSRASCLGSL